MGKNSLPPDRIRLGKYFSLQNSLLLRKRHWEYFAKITFPPLSFITKRGFLRYSQWEPGEVLEIKQTKGWRPTGVSHCHSHVSPHSAFSNTPNLSFKCSYHFMAPVVPTLGNRSWTELSGFAVVVFLKT